MAGPARDPYRRVKRELRREVGFACPVDDCANPYLTWHHFDPPWRVEKHHRPEGMIALCLEHAAQADNGAFTEGQLQEMKRAGLGHRPRSVSGRFNWMRHEVLARVGGNFYYRTPVIFQLGDTPCVWLNRDERGYLQVNFRMPTVSGRPRASIIENFWSVPTAVEELICPPMGRLIHVRYANGDRFKTEFFEVTDPNALQQRYPRASVSQMADVLAWPLTVVEVAETAAGTNLEFGPNSSQIGGVMMQECFMSDCSVGVRLDVSEDQLAHLFPGPS